MVLTTRSGRKLDPLNITADDIDIEDIAYSLSMQCRFNGHCKNFYSVAQHSIRVAEAATGNPHHEKYRLELLLHDAAEAYIGDLITPIKRLCVEYTDIEFRINLAIAKKFNLNSPYHPISNCEIDINSVIDYYDKRLLMAEFIEIMPGDNIGEPEITIPPIPSASNAAELFLEKYKQYQALR